MVALLLTLSLMSVPTDLANTDFTLHVDVIPHASVTQADLDLARQIATSLLRSAGVVIDWRDCDARIVVCGDAERDLVSIDIRLVHAVTREHGDECGAVVNDSRGRMPSVLIYLSIVDDKIRRFHLGPAGRSDPRISTLRRGHLIGFIVAHELGHALELPHAPRGVMKADLDVDDIRSLRQSRLTFLARERGHIQDALAAAAREQKPSPQRRGQ